MDEIDVERNDPPTKDQNVEDVNPKMIE